MKHWKIAFALLALITVSALLGAWGGLHYAYRHPRKEHWDKTWQRSLAEKLKLEPAQRSEASQAFDSAVKQIGDLRELTLVSELAIVQDLIEKFEAVLTPEQKVKFAKMKPKPQEITLQLLLVESSKNNGAKASDPALPALPSKAK